MLAFSLNDTSPVMKLVYFLAQLIGAFQWFDLFLKKMDLKFLVSGHHG